MRSNELLLTSGEFLTRSMDDFNFLLYAFYNAYVFYYLKNCTEISLRPKGSKSQQSTGLHRMLFTPLPGSALDGTIWDLDHRQHHLCVSE